jgi:hypothetical protein
MKHKTLLLVLSAAAYAVTAHADEWKTLNDSEEGWVISYPSFLTPAPEERDFTFHYGLKFDSTHEGVSLGLHFRAVYALYNYKTNDTDLKAEDVPKAKRLAWATKQLFQNELHEPSNKIDYSVCKDNWFVVSGVASDGKEFYYKVYVAVDNDEGMIITNSFEFSYPAAQHEIYDPICAKIARSFKLQH